MNLDDFRTIADDRTRHLRMTPEIERKILRNCRSRPAGKTAWIAAAACFVVMVVSGVALMEHIRTSPKSGDMIITAHLTQPQTGSSEEPGTAHKTAIENESDAVLASDGIKRTGSVMSLEELAALPGPVSVGEYSEGYAPAQNAEDLWGFVDAGGAWVIEPVFAQVSPVKNLQSTAVRASGETETLLFLKETQ